MSALISLEAAAQRLAVDTRTVRRWVSDGRLPAFRIGPRLLRVNATDVDALLQRVPTAIR